MRRVSFSIALLHLLAIANFAHAEDPFEPGEQEVAAPGSFALTPLSEGAVRAIRFYQTDIGPNSIARCPFRISCSAFAARAIEESGLIGLVAFFDRIFFRENADMFRHYERVLADDGRVRLDDELDP